MRRNEFRYTPAMLKAFARYYPVVYDSLSPSNWLELIIMKADFDRALSALGKKWEGLTSFEFNDYKQYAKLQRLVIADMLIPEETDWQLHARGFHNPPRGRRLAYKRMANFLNAGASVEDVYSHQGE